MLRQSVIFLDMVRGTSNRTKQTRVIRPKGWYDKLLAFEIWKRQFLFLFRLGRITCTFVLTLVIIEVPFPITEKLTDCCFVIALRLNCSGFLFVIDRGSLDHNLKANSTIKIIIKKTYYFHFIRKKKKETEKMPHLCSFCLAYRRAGLLHFPRLPRFHFFQALIFPQQ